MAAKKQTTKGKARGARKVPRLTLTSVELGGWPMLGAPVRFDISPRRTVLIGRNGAGKSLLLEGIYQARKRILFGSVTPGPASFECMFADPTGHPLHYRYEVTGETPEPLLRVHEAPDLQWEERCWGTAKTRPVWVTSRGKLGLGKGAQILLPQWAGLLVVLLGGDPLPPEGQAIRSFLDGMTLVRAGLPRDSSSSRSPILLPSSPKPGERLPGRQQRIEMTTRQLVDWHQNEPERFDEFVELGRKLDIWRSVEFNEYSRTHASPADGFVSFSFDGTNIGLLPDGTLRLVDTLTTLLDTPSGGMLLLEEPETGIHPGLLARLLSILDSYTQDRQLLISTHSHQVVNWASPQEVRLVERREGATRVSSLSDEQVQRLVPYLEEEGTLGDFLYGGGADA